MWNVFTPMAAPEFGESAYWLEQSAKIDAGSYDFSQMRIYTATNTQNQEVVGGHVSAMSAVPEPAEWLMLIVGMGILTWGLLRPRPVLDQIG
jgi:hypothetical protein